MAACLVSFPALFCRLSAVCSLSGMSTNWTKCAPLCLWILMLFYLQLSSSLLFSCACYQMKSENCLFLHHIKIDGLVHGKKKVGKCVFCGIIEKKVSFLCTRGQYRIP